MRLRSALALGGLSASVWLTGCGGTNSGCQHPGEGPNIVITAQLHYPHYRLLIDQAVTVAAPVTMAVRLTDPTVLTLQSRQTVGGTQYERLYATHLGSTDVLVSGRTLTRVAVVCRL